MQYKVICVFNDLQDFSHPYRVGDKYPRSGLYVSEERIKELASDKNRRQMPLIEKVDDEFSQYMNAPVESNEVTYTKTEINRMAIAELKEVAKANGIDGADEMTGADLKKVLISKFGL
jgi:5'-deoxynucleotidase YfbR-like HD superfamily hydrolase